MKSSKSAPKRAKKREKSGRKIDPNDRVILRAKDGLEIHLVGGWTMNDLRRIGCCASIVDKDETITEADSWVVSSH